MKSFSERKGLKVVAEVIQTNGMNDALRNSLWNVLDIALWSTEGYVYRQHGTPEIESFARALWFSYFKQPMDSIPDRSSKVLTHIRDEFFQSKWFEAYDLLEFIVNHYERKLPRLVELLNRVLTREISGYRFVSGHLTDITSPEEVQMLNEALADSRFAGVSGHLQRSLELYADRETPDYRNSIKESISAVEAIARIVAESPKATLGDALKTIEKRGTLHPALKDGFLKIYGYTSDEGGIRHAMLDEPNLTPADAKYFLLSCTSFANYLKSHLPQ